MVSFRGDLLRHVRIIDFEAYLELKTYIMYESNLIEWNEVSSYDFEDSETNEKGESTT